ncbi:unnamed protein product [Chironomus riparius]|uniref:G-protein coupled receptors family 1 profile domain-containing protein n=1 Tax=Chironomus riparius TaxID=315576 RepID=A0A9N9WSB4_9DIPT|nr:unnamed protein product [Chironomus riparius]
MSIDYYSDYSDFSNISFENAADFTELDFEKNPIFRIIAGIYLFILILVGFFGNILVLQIIIVKWKIQTSFNLFLANIAVADIFFIFGTVISLTSHMFVGEFIFGDTMCKVVTFFEYFGPILSIFTIVTALIILQFNIRLLLSALIIGFLYIVTSLPAFAQSVLFRTYDSHSTDSSVITVCAKSYPSLEAEKGLDELDKIFQIKLPMAILSIYIIFWIIHKSINCTRLMSGFIYEKMLTVMAFVYIILWIPALFCLHNIEMLNEEYKVPMLCTLFLCHLLCGAAIIYKPFLYMIMHEGIQREFQKFLYIRSQNPERSQISRTF